MRDLWLSVHASFGSGIVCLSFSSRLTRVQGTPNKSMKLAMGPCRGHDGLLMVPRGVASTWVDVNSHRTMMALRCCATWYARRWGGTCTLTTVVATFMIIRKCFISMRGSFQTPTKRKTGSHIAFIGVGWVSSLGEFYTTSSL
jgi:hypothetical protein